MMAEVQVVEIGRGGESGAAIVPRPLGNVTLGGSLRVRSVGGVPEG